MPEPTRGLRMHRGAPRPKLRPKMSPVAPELIPRRARRRGALLRRLSAAAPPATPVQSRPISDLRLRSDQPEVNQPKKTVSAATFA